MSGWKCYGCQEVVRFSDLAVECFSGNGVCIHCFCTPVVKWEELPGADRLLLRVLIRPNIERCEQCMFDLLEAAVPHWTATRFSDCGYMIVSSASEESIFKVVFA